MDAVFKFFKKGSGGNLRFSPDVDFPTKTGFLGNPSKVVFHNLTGDDLTFTDDDKALKPGQTLKVRAREKEEFDIDGSVVPGNVYGFSVTPTLTTSQEPLLAAAANPEIIIVG